VENHIVRVQFKISLEEMRHICRRLGADRPPLWRSPAWVPQVVQRQLCTSTGHFRHPDSFRFSQRSPAGGWMLAAPTIYAAALSPHGTTSDRPIPQSSSAKKLSDIVNFLKSLKFWRNIMYQIMQFTENARFLSNLYMCVPGNGP
jgi:hypothetical protein